MFIKGVMGGIYKIICLPTGKIYIGSSINIDSRFKNHIWCLQKNRHRNTYLQRAWNKYRGNNFKFEIIEIIQLNSLITKEKFWIKKFKSYNRKYGFNIIEPEMPPMLGRFHNQKTRLKISEKLSGIKHTKETRLKMSLASKGKKKSKTQIENMCKAKRGTKNPMSKLNSWIIRIIRQLLKYGEFTQTEIAKIFNVSKQCICDIKHNRKWKLV